MNGAVILGDERMSRDVLLARATRLATLLQQAGVADGGTVALLMRNDADYLTAVEACRYVGARYIALNWHAASFEIAAIVADAGASFLLGHDDLVAPVRASLPSSCQVLAFAAPGATADAYRSGQAVDAMPRLGELVVPYPPISGTPKPFLGIYAYTSGSTGRPKGIVRHYRETSVDLVEVYRAQATNMLQIRAGDRMYIAAPLYHSAPNGQALSAFFSDDCDLFLAPKFDPVALLSDIETHRITHLYLVPTMMVRLLKLPPDMRRRFDTSSLRVVFSTGSPCPIDVKAAMIDWMGPIFYESYGSSELGLMTLIDSAGSLAKPGSVGRPVAGASILILDDELNELPPGETGTIYIRMPALERFEYSNAEGNLANQRHDGHATVGDMGYLDEDGFLFISDRKKEMIITGGANVFPSEIEAVIVQMPEVMDCAVFGAPDPEFGETIVAAVKCRPGRTITLAEVHAFLGGRIARFKFPKKLDLHGELPREDSGKIFKRRLREPYWAGLEKAV